MNRITDTHIQVYDDCEPAALVDLKVGDKVQDDLTGKMATIIKFNFGKNTIGVCLDSEHLGGLRHLWEVSKV